MEHITTEIDIDASAARAWAALADLRGVARWIPGISAVEVDGLTRVCTFDGGAVQHEEISDFAPDSMSYRYRIRGGPLPLTDNEGRFRVVATGESGSRVAWQAAFTVAEGAPADEITEMLRGAYGQVADNLRRLIEAGD